MSFDERAENHDRLLEHVLKTIKRRQGGVTGTMGTEFDKDEMKRAMRGLTDPTSLSMRYRPDTFWIAPPPISRTILIEVKTVSNKYKNLSIELSSYLATEKWNYLGGQTKSVIVVGVIIKEETKYDRNPKIEKMIATWFPEIPRPFWVTIPRRIFNSSVKKQEEENRILEEEKHIRGVLGNNCQPKVEDKRNGNGSGKSYFLVSLCDKCWYDLDCFLVQLKKGKV